MAIEAAAAGRASGEQPTAVDGMCSGLAAPPPAAPGIAAAPVAAAATGLAEGNAGPATAAEGAEDPAVMGRRMAFLAAELEKMCAAAIRVGCPLPSTIPTAIGGHTAHRTTRTIRKPPQGPDGGGGWGGLGCAAQAPNRHGGQT